MKNKEKDKDRLKIHSWKISDTENKDFIEKKLHNNLLQLNLNSQATF